MASDLNSTEFSLSQFMQDCKTRVEAKLDFCLKQSDSISGGLNEAMRYSTLNGGKRFRPILIYATLQALDKPLHLGDASASAVELVHSYSLVHDDLPAMDNDDLRRGRPTCHIAFDEATAILAGDALQSLAFEIIAADSELTQDLDSSVRLKLIVELANASGTAGMAAGQALDLAAEGKNLTLAELEQVHAHKTGVLIAACCRMAAISAGCVDKNKLIALQTYAAAVGLAFQVQDDILDITSATEILGKPQGADKELSKATYPQILGLQGAQEMAQSLLSEALDAISEFDGNAECLRQLARYVVERKY